jgi:soluble lytic murein transglycosylase-like protein
MAMFENISAIEMRMQEIKSKFNTFNAPVAPPQGTPEASGVNFSRILSSMQEAQMKLPVSSSGGGGEQDYAGAINEAARQWKLDPALLKAVVKQESGFNPSAVSGAGAMGLMQLMPDTARELGVNNPMDARENLMGGARYLSSMLDRFDGNLTKALAAYNAGPGAVEKYGGVPPYEETQNYVSSILAMYADFRKKV